jgi:hypothetical protein
VRRGPWHPEGFSHLLPTAYQAVLETGRGGLELLPKVVFDDSELFYEFFLGYMIPASGCCEGPRFFMEFEIM